ncbi:hypothetical protein PY365_02280 [Roseiarcaceae bacterium H3SJ34-1]|uniref:alpha/beta fold hydrolase n=1 Tax=Terripilifer ovatus TaxID=3032367 RepID=UPI003AB955E7|nr:hypothetical protein [Roseiarcaceae bacterium H3SJ34-1]
MSFETNDKLVADLLHDEAMLRRVDWPEWLSVAAPAEAQTFHKSAVTQRFGRNGYEWDIHGTLYTPERERLPGIGFVLFHGGAGSEKEVEETPDGRPGLASVLAAQGFRCLAVTYPGHIPASGIWDTPVSEREPVYLLDRQLSPAEIADRHDKCTFNTIVEGAALLVEASMPGYQLLAFGHSTGGPMSMFLYRFLRSARVIGIVGWGSGGPDGWYREWVEWCSHKKDAVAGPNSISRRSVESFRKAGYEDTLELCPWGTAEDYFTWANRFKSQLKTGLCDNQHSAHVNALVATAKRVGLPVDEYIDCLRDPDPDWLAGVGVLLMVGENDRNHWLIGATEEKKLEIFMGTKFAQRARRTKVVLVSRYGHFGYVGAYNEKIAFIWVEALMAGFFDGVARNVMADAD